MEILAYSFVQHAIIAGILVSLVSGIIGPLIVVNRMVFLAGGIAHTAYGGIGMALFFSFPIFLGASLFAVVASLIMAFLTINHKERMDTVIGLIWAVGMAIGIVFVDLTEGYTVDLMSYLFGSILAVSVEDIYFMLTLFVVVASVILLWYKDILAVSYDSEYAMLQGINVKFFYTIILILSALSVVIAIKVVGLILVIALLTIPVYMAEKFASSLMSMMLFSGAFASFSTLIGLYLSYRFDITSGACIILVLVGLLALIQLSKVFQKD